MKTLLTSLLLAVSAGGAGAQTLAGQSWIIGLPCDQVSVQAVIDNQPQQIIGIACREPDDHWLFVDAAPPAVTLFGPMDRPGDAGPPVSFGLQSPFGYRDWLRAMPQRKPKGPKPYGNRPTTPRKYSPYSPQSPYSPSGKE